MNIMINFPRLFGVHSELKSEVRIWGPIYLVDAIILIVTGALVIMGNKMFWDCQSRIPMFVFDVATIFLGIYSIWKPRSNPGKRNITLLTLTFHPTIRFFQSIDAERRIHMNTIFDTGKNASKRMLVTRSDLRGDNQ